MKSQCVIMRTHTKASPKAAGVCTIAVIVVAMGVVVITVLVVRLVSFV